MAPAFKALVCRFRRGEVPTWALEDRLAKLISGATGTTDKQQCAISKDDPDSQQ